MHGTGRNNGDRHTLVRGKPGVGEPMPFQANARKTLAAPRVAQVFVLEGAPRNRLRWRGKTGFGIPLPVQDFVFTHSVLLSTHREVQQKPSASGRFLPLENLWELSLPNIHQIHKNLITTTVLSVPVGKPAATGKLFPMLKYQTSINEDRSTCARCAGPEERSCGERLPAILSHIRQLCIPLYIPRRNFLAYFKNVGLTWDEQRFGAKPKHHRGLLT